METAHQHTVISLYLQKIKFKDPFFAPPVVVVSPSLKYEHNKSRLSGSRSGCKAVTAWVEVSTLPYFYECSLNNKDNGFFSWFINVKRVYGNSRFLE